MEELMRMEHISKRFGNFYANKDVNLTVYRGEVLTLLGENGAGKSTLMNILIGLYQPTEGKIFLNGKEERIESPGQAVKLGIGMVHQHFMLVEAQTVFDNIILGDKRSKGIFINRAARRKEILELSERYGLDVELDAKITEISVGAQQRVEILKALYHGAELLILDEPTAALTDIEVEGLFAIMNKLKSEGKSVIFISHKMREVLHISDRITILRAGEVITTVNCSETDGQKLANLMIGRELTKSQYEKKEVTADPVVKLEDVRYHENNKHNGLAGVSMEIRPGEIVGIAGVDGNGQTQLAQLITGVIGPEKGHVHLAGSKVSTFDPFDFIESGVAHVPEDRNLQGLIGDMSIADNLVLKSTETDQFSRGKGLLLKKKDINAYAEELVKKYDIRCTSIDQAVRSLSGGNQQKVVLAKWLMSNPKLLILDNPTQGVDVGAKEEIYNIIHRLAEEGVAIVVLSSEAQEVIRVCDRTLVLFHGRQVGELKGDEMTEHSIMYLATGGNQNESVRN